MLAGNSATHRRNTGTLPQGLAARSRLANPLRSVHLINENQFSSYFPFLTPGRLPLNPQRFVLSSIICLDSGKTSKPSGNRVSAFFLIAGLTDGVHGWKPGWDKNPKKNKNKKRGSPERKRALLAHLAFRADWFIRYPGELLYFCPKEG